MQILHVTDLHYAPDQPFQKALIEALLKDLRQRVADGFSPEFVVFSGDLVHNPDEVGVYEEFDAQFLRPLLLAVNLDEQEVVFCPGNHDVSQTALRDWSLEREKLKAAMTSDPAELSKLLQTGPFQSYIKAINSGFFALAERWSGPWQNPLAHTYSFPDQKVSFVAINSGFGCGLEGSDYDRGKLAIPTEDVLAGFQAVPDGHQIFSLMHHTLADLTNAASRELVSIIDQRAAIHFFGHVHDPRPTAQKSPGGSCFMLQGGALYEKKKRIYNGYALVFTGPAPDRIAARYRTYYVGRNMFDVGTNVADGGVFYSSDASKSYWENLVPTPTNDEVSLWLMETASNVASELDKTITERSLLETFVDPVITGSPNADEGVSQRRLSTSQLLESKKNIVIACDSEYGATALLSYLTMRFHSEPLSLDTAQVPIFINTRPKLASYSAAVASMLRRNLPESEDVRFNLQPLHDTGRIVVLVDNVDPGNASHVSFLTMVRKDFPKARLIVASKMPFVDTQRLRPVIGVDEFDFLQLRTLTRAKVRTLVEKWKLPPQYQIDAVVEEIDSKFRALGIPLTAAYVVIYLAVLQEIQGYNPINSSTVIEQFIEGALQKYKPAYIFRSSFDFRNQIDYLAAIAERMCKINLFTVPYEEIYSWTKQYFDEIGLEHDFPKLHDYFVDNRVFSLEGNSLCFRYNIFLSFFIAHRMIRSEEFKQWLLSEQHYTNYVTEIDIYCGLSRQDMSVLEFFGAEYARLANILEGYVKPSAWIDRLEKLSLPAVKKNETEAFMSGIEKQLTGNMDAGERDEAISGKQVPENVKPDLKRPEVVGEIPSWIYTLRAYTVSLKNLENIPKAKKEEHLHKILEGWSTVMLYGCIVFKEVVEKRTLQVGPAKFVFDLPDNVDARLLRLMFSHIPVVVSDWVRRDLGSQKLSLQLRNESLAHTLSESFLQTSLYADLKLTEYLGRLKALKEKASQSDSRVFLEFILIKMRDIFLRLGLHHDEQEGFLRLAAELSAEIKGLTGDERQREIGRYTTDLRRRDRVQRLRENAP